MKGKINKLIIERRKRFFIALFISLLAYILIILIYTICYIKLGFNPLNIDISDFILVSCGLPGLLAVFTFILTRIKIKMEKTRHNLIYLYHTDILENNEKIRYKKETINHYFKNKLTITYLIIIVLFFSILMAFLFVAGGLVAEHKKQYGTFYDSELEKNYLIITAYGECRIVMEYNCSDDDSITVMYGKYRVVPIENINETIINFNNIIIEKI